MALWQIRLVFVEMVRRHHVVFSIFVAHGEAQVAYTLPQRVSVLACMVFTSMCVSALLLGRRSFDLQGRAWAAMIAAACMVGALAMPVTAAARFTLPRHSNHHYYHHFSVLQ